MTTDDILSIFSDTRSGTMRRVNKALEALGLAQDDVDFVRGDGYFYLGGYSGAVLPESAIYTYRVGHQTVGEWIDSIFYLLTEQSEYLSSDARAVVERVSAARGK